MVAETPWIKLRGFSRVASKVEPVKAETVTAGAAMNIGTDYFISPNCRVFEVSTGLGFFLPGKHEKLAAANTVLYYSAKIGDVEGDKATALWVTNNGAALRLAATEGIQESAKLVRHALNLMGGITNVMLRPASSSWALSRSNCG